MLTDFSVNQFSPGRREGTAADQADARQTGSGRRRPSVPWRFTHRGRVRASGVFFPRRHPTGEM